MAKKNKSVGDEYGNVERENHTEASMKNESLKLLQSSQYGQSPEFLNKHTRMIREIKRTLSEKMSVGEIGDTPKLSKNKDQNSEYLKIISSITQPDEGKGLLNPNSDIDSISGTYLVDETSQTLADEYASVDSNRYSNMKEYERITDIIPQLGKSTDLVVRECINVDEFSKRAISNFYTETDGDIKSAAESIIENLLDEYGIEESLEEMVHTAITTGVKPMSVLPQEDIIDMVEHTIKHNMDSGMALESIIDNIDSHVYGPDEDFMLPSPINSAVQAYESLMDKTVTKESSDFKYIKDDCMGTIGKYTESIITNDIIDSWKNTTLEELSVVINDKMSHMSTESIDHNPLKIERDKLFDRLSDSKNNSSVEEAVRLELTDLVMEMDKSLEVIDPRKTHKYYSKKRFEHGESNSTHATNNEFVSDYYGLMNTNDGTKAAKSDTKTFSIDGIPMEVKSDGTFDKGALKKFNKRRAILTEYEPENVIPITVGSRHIGYYIVELGGEIASSQNNMLRNRGSFTEMIKRIGVGNDITFMNNGGGNHDAITDNNFDNGTFAYTGNMSRNQYQPSSKNSGNISSKNEILKKLMIKTMMSRLGNKAIYDDDGAFQSNMMNLLKDDVIFKKKIRFTYIPEDHMVYMTRKRDKHGFPVSIFDGTLFMAYSYMASMVTNMLAKTNKASDDEVIEFNVGKSREIGLSIDTLLKSTSTRTVSASGIMAGVESIFRSVGVHKKRVVPVIEGEKLYETTNITRVNDVNLDDNYTKELLKAVLLRTDVPPTSLDMLDKDEYAAGLATHNENFRNSIINLQKNICSPKWGLTKLVRLLVTYSDVDGEAEETKINVNKILIRLKTPNTLSVHKVYEEIDNVGRLVDKLMEIKFPNDDREGEEYKAVKFLAKEGLYKMLSSSNDWKSIEDIMNAAVLGAPKQMAVWSGQDEKISTDPLGGEKSSGGGGGWG